MLSLLRWFRGMDLLRKTNLSKLERSRLITTHFLAISLGGYFLVVALLFGFLGHQFAAVFTAVSGFTIVVTSFMIRSKWNNFAKFILIANLSNVVFFMSCTLGSEALIQAIYLLIIPMAMYVFEKRLVLYRALSIGLALISFFILDFNQYNLFTSVELGPAFAFVLKWASLMGSIVLAGFIIRTATKSQNMQEQSSSN